MIYNLLLANIAYLCTLRFSPDVAWDLSDEEVERLGSEDDGTVTERAELQKKLEILEKGLNGLDTFTARSGAQAY
jgi:hypothetical protein